MRTSTLSHVSCAFLACFALVGTAAAHSDALLERTVCVKLALEQKAMEADGIQALLALPPADIVAQRGRSIAQKVRGYIDLREKVLFQCPLHVLNATAAPLEEREKYMPPLPLKGPRRARVELPRMPLVPLPVPRQRL